MRSTILLAVGVSLATLRLTSVNTPGQMVEIESLSHNGVLTWTTPSTNAVSSIEWAPALTSDWRSSWSGLTDIRATTTNVAVEVPMFYRVKCWPNGQLVSFPVGRVYEYAGTNSMGETWTSQWICTALVVGLSTNFSSNRDWVLVVNPTDEVTLPHETHMNLMLYRSTDKALWSFDGPGQENIWWQAAQVGTTWTNSVRDTYAVCTIAATNASVTVPAGTFDCIRISARYFGSGLPERTESWVTPGLAMVQEFRFITHTNPVPDEVYQLQSWSGR